MEIMYWTTGETLYIEQRQERKAAAHSGLTALFAQFFFITVGTDPDTLEALFDTDSETIPLGIEFMDGATFMYNEVTSTAEMGPYCGKAGDAEPSREGCGFINESTMWTFEEDAFSGTASRPLNAFHELKAGVTYSLVGNYMIIEEPLPNQEPEEPSVH